MTLPGRWRDPLSTVDRWLERSVMLVAIRKGLMLIMPFLLIGSFGLIITSLPVASYQKLMTTVAGQHWKSIGDSVFQSSFGFLSVVMTLSIGYSYACEANEYQQNQVNPMVTALVSLTSLLTLSGFGSGGFSLATFGTTGLFGAVLVSSLSAKLFVTLGRVDRLRARSFTDGASPAFNEGVCAIIPALVTILLFAGAGFILYAVLGIRDLQQLLAGLSVSLFRHLGNSLWSGLLFLLLVHLFWFFGVHGSNVLEPVAQGIYAPALASNHQFVANHMPPEHIFTKTFLDVFVLMGGCGATLCLVLAIFISARHKNLRRHASLSLIPILFNVNELILFGIPIVLNPVFILPFVATPLLLALVAYAATASGLVPYTIHPVEWTTPVLLGGYAATGSLAGSMLQLVNLGLGILCYLPFIRISEHQTGERLKGTLVRIGEAIENSSKSRVRSDLLSRQGNIGMAARALAADLEHDLDRGRLTLFYQPQFNDQGEIIGVEALLRWKHELYGYIAPPIAIALAEESGFFERLDQWVLDHACHQMHTLLAEGITGITMSINTTAPQLEGGAVYAGIQAALAQYGIPPEFLEIEITEKDALLASHATVERMKEIRALGVRLAMDDFGMGHTSLLYLKEYIFDTVKIDGSLVTGLMSNPVCSEIIGSIVMLGKTLSFSVLAEYVETEAQRDRLRQLGCRHYQGYLYSKPLPEEALAGFIEVWRRREGVRADGEAAPRQRLAAAFLGGK